MFTKSHGIIVLDFSLTQDMSIVRNGIVHLECTFTEPLEESIALILLNKFETSWEITPDGSVLLATEHKSNNQCIQFGSLHLQIKILLHTLGFPRT